MDLLRSGWRVEAEQHEEAFLLEFWPKARLASISIDVDVVSASTIWTPTLTPASSDPWLREVGVAERRPVRTSRDVMSGLTPQGPVLPPPPPVDYGVFMQGLTQAHTQAALQALLEAQAQVPAQDHGGPSTMERFKRMLPPSFKGESDPLLAESWMREIEKIFRAIRCADEDMVTLATYMLHASLLRTRFEDGAVDVAWDEFVRLFRAKFVPEHVQDRMEQEFLSLTQGPMTVLEYEARFSEFSKYAPHIVTDERRKTKKFMMGLKPSLRTRLVAFDHRTLDEALSAACRQKGEMEQYLEEKKASQKRPAATFQWQDKKKAVYQTHQRSVAVGSSQVPSVRSLGVKKECPHCGKTHGGTECWMIMGKCLKCGSSDHKIKDCPRLQQGVQCGAPAPAPWLREVGVAERRPVRTSRDVMSGLSSRLLLHRVLYFPHRHLWIMEYSCKVWCKPCRCRLIPRQHSRLSWRLRWCL
ncbi:hypothetical protein Taro_016438 [Colocasia esculenta]|uniref:CCHC-type domain-containing protein n=1 Tax=Colocasia esculenta TaxID=4460 RepID=A0A843USX0_COLES|nr:hypothetical protein [Colocasia esculenta]